MSLALGLALLLGCGWSVPACTSPEQALTQGADPLRCSQVARARDDLALLAGRPLTVGVRDALQRDLTTAWTRDAASTRTQLDTLHQQATLPEGAAPAIARSHALWAALKADGPLTDSLSAAAVPWSVHDDDRMVLSEVDIEGWIFYASLAHEVGGGKALRVSVADRVHLYDVAKQRFSAGSTAEREALVSVGAVWPSVQQRWRAASYEQQQAWALAAPLPPVQDGTAAEYVEAVLRGDVVQHARALNETLGPLALTGS